MDAMSDRVVFYNAGNLGRQRLFQCPEADIASAISLHLFEFGVATQVDKDLMASSQPGTRPAWLRTDRSTDGSKTTRIIESASIGAATSMFS